MCTGLCHHSLYQRWHTLSQSQRERGLPSGSSLETRAASPVGGSEGDTLLHWLGDTEQCATPSTSPAPAPMCLYIHTNRKKKKNTNRIFKNLLTQIRTRDHQHYIGKEPLHLTNYNSTEKCPKKTVLLCPNYCVTLLKWLNITQPNIVLYALRPPAAPL